MMYKEFNRLIKKTKITVYEISVLNLLVEHKIVIHLLERFIIRDEEQWLENRNYLFLEFL